MKKYFFRSVFLLSIVAFCADSAAAQPRQMTRREYIASFAPLAIRHQQLFGIPASIKIAQGIVESQHGNSELARLSNNHFGIKCKPEWTGRTVTWTDDEPDECFRAYDCVEESWKDHSEFLTGRERYSRLFKLCVTDYKGWAHGLRECGYATNPNYADMLIRIIEENELHLFDSGKHPSWMAHVELPEPAPKAEPAKKQRAGRTVEVVAESAKGSDFIPCDSRSGGVIALTPGSLQPTIHKSGGRNIFIYGGSRCIVAQTGDTYPALARTLGMPQKRLLRFNRAQAEDVITNGQLIYIERSSRSTKNR